jgi:hypothetical protein
MIEIINTKYYYLILYINLAPPLPYSTVETGKRPVLPGAKILSRQGQNIFCILYKID